MSTQNDLINYQNVIKEANSLINEQIKLWGGVVSSIQKVGKVTPSSFVNAQKQVNEALVKSTELTEKQRLADIRLQQAREKAFDDYEKGLQAEIALKEKSVQSAEKASARKIKTNEQEVLAERKLQKAREEAFDRFEKKIQKEQALLERSNNMYNFVQDRVNKLTASYNNLATRKELGQQLTEKEIAQLDRLQNELNQYGNVLKKVDAQIGNNRRNVGNYKSGFDGLGNSINQITRELPAFTFSAQTGFLALSNNLPILADEIKRVSDNVAEMRAKGQQVPGVMSQILTSFLSWQTALSIGVTLITVYGKEIGEFFTKIFDGAKKVDKATLAVNAYNEALKDTDFQTAYTDVNKLGASFEQAEKGTLSKKKALEDYNKTLGSTIGEAKTYNEALKLYNENADRYIEATLRMSVANQFLQKSAEEAAKRIEAGSTAQITAAERFKAIYDVLNQNVLDTKNNGDDPFINFFRAIKKTGEDTNKVYSTVMDNRNKKINEAKENEKSFLELAKESLSEYEQLTKNFVGKTEKTKKPKKEKDNTVKELIQEEYELAKVRLERQKAEAKYAEDMETYFTKELELANLEYQYKKKLANLEISDKERLAIALDKLQEEYALKVEEIGRSEIANQEEVFKKLSDGIKKFFEFKQKAREEDEKKRQEGLKNEYELTQLQNEIDLESLGGNRGGKYWETRQKEIEDWYTNQKELHRNNAQELLRIDKEYELQNIQLLNDRKGAFKQAMTEMYSSALGEMGAGSLAQFFNGQFEEIWAGADTLQEKMAAVMMAIGQIANDVFNAMSERQNAYFDTQYKNLETEKDLALQFAGENTAGREAIEKQYEEKKRALQMQQAKQQKQMAMMQATINIAQGITSALTQPAPYSFILAALVGVLGAVQLAKIASTPLPQFYTGTSNAPEGLALTQERGAEMITDKHGNIKTLGNNKGAQLTYLNKGDKVFTADETTQKLNELLISSGVSPIVNVSGGSGLTEEQMRNIMQDTLAKQPKNSIIFDENGIKAFTSKENRRTILKNRNVRI